MKKISGHNKIKIVGSVDIILHEIVSWWTILRNNIMPYIYSLKLFSNIFSVD